VLEIGTHIGASTIHIARALAANGGNARLTTVDVADVNDGHDAPWRAAGMVTSPRDLVKELGCASNVEFVVGSALDYMQHAADRYDLVSLDGDHRPHAVYQEVAAALRVLAPGGLVLLHDYYPGRKALFPDGRVIDGPVRAVERVMREERRIEGRPLRALPWPTKQGVSATSLALLTRASS
jgi:predicted O-methyltransferase YrrM